jgi:formate dehydrogenase major subunit
MKRTAQLQRAATGAPVDFTLDGEAVQALPGESLLKTAQRLGVRIPHLCHQDGLRPDGNCRACVVEIEGERTLAPSCCRSATPGMQVHSGSDRARKSQEIVLELLLSDMPERGHKWTDGPADIPSPDQPGQHGELSAWASRMEVAVRPALQSLRRAPPAADLSHPAMAVNLDACIQCNRCVRACREEQMNDVIGMARRGAHSAVVFDLGDALGASSCVACGECVQACPTGALMPSTQLGSQAVDRTVDSVCPFCGVGCLLTYHVKDQAIVAVQGRDGPANQGRLCVKGRFGFDYAEHPQRLVMPLVRLPGVAKDPAQQRHPEDWREVFREASWDEALALATGPMKALRDTHGPKSLAGFGSAKGTNEEAYLFQKLVRTGFGSNNVDHCTRLCHASSVAALLEGVGSGSVSNPVNDVEHAGLILVIGSNPTANHPVAASWMKNAARQGTRIVLADPRKTELSRHAWRSLQFHADTDVAMLNALIHTVIEEGLTDETFIRERVNDFESLKESVQAFSPEAMAPVCGIPAATLREVAREFARPSGGKLGAMILWGMGVSQHTHGTDNVRCLIALSMVTGQIGKPGSGLHPLRGQNNVQGASDAGLIPMMFPNYQRVTDPAAHAWFEKFWDTKLDDQPGYTVVEIMHKALAPDSDPHKVRGMYIMGENPAMSDPDLNHARHALASLQHLVVQDIFMTETAWLADVVLPASAWPEKTGTASNTDRMVQLGRQAIDPPGQAKPDLWIIQQMARGMGLQWNYAEEAAAAQGRPKQGMAPSGGSAAHQMASVAALVYEEMRQAMAVSIAGISWERLQRESSVTYPCLTADDPGERIEFTRHFATKDGRAHLVPAQFIPAQERPDADYPFVLITGRQLEHWHTGSMTRRARVLDALEPQATASLCGADMLALGLNGGDALTVRSRRGSVVLRVRQDDGTPKGTVFMPFAYHEAAANLLTHAALDPFGKIPEVKYCAVALSSGGSLAPTEGYGPWASSA